MTKISLIYFFISLFLVSCSDGRDRCDKISDQILSKLAKEMHKQKLYAIGSGGGCSSDEKINLIEITFQSREILNIDEARKLIVTSTQALQKIIDSNPESPEFFETYPPPLNIILISIIGEIPEIGNSDQIWGALLFRGKIYYDIEILNPPPMAGGYLVTIQEESFEEAVRILEELS